MSVITPPGPPELDQDPGRERRDADLEALIEEARRRARRRRQRNGAAVLLLVCAGAAAFFGFGGHRGGGAGNASLAHAPGAQTPAASSGLPLAPLPPDAGFAKSFAFDPRNPEIVYVLTGGLRNSVFKTTDGGAHWRATATSGIGWVGSNEALTADPRHPGTLYAGTQLAVYKTVDGGSSWRPSSRGLFVPPLPTDRDKGWITALADDPTNTKIVYAGSDRVSKSTDGGYSWKTVFPSHPARRPRESVSALAIAPTRPEAIYAITGDFAPTEPNPSIGRTVIYKSTDAGTTWQATKIVRGTAAPTALAVDPRDPATVYAAIGAKVLKTTNAGATWRSIARGLPVMDRFGSCHCRSLGAVKLLTVDSRRTGTVYAGLKQGGVYKTTDGGRSWHAALGVPLFLIYALAVDPARPATIFVAGQSETTGQNRIVRSTDSGRSWVTAP